MAQFVQTEGIFRCRLQLDPQSGSPCIAVDEHYAWDAVNKTLDRSKPLGGLQIVLRADAFPIDENGEVSSVAQELNLDRFGITIITKKEQGEESRPEVIESFMRIFGLSKPDEVLTIASADPEKLANAVFDVRTYYTTNKNTGKQYLNYWFAPMGGATRKAPAFVLPSANKAILDKYRAKLRAECKSINIVTPPTQTAQNAIPTPRAMPTPPPAEAKANSALPPRETASAIDLNGVWDMWTATHPDDASTGEQFYSAIQKMYGDKSAQDLTAVELNAFVRANNLHAVDEELTF